MSSKKSTAAPKTVKVAGAKRPRATKAKAEPVEDVEMQEPELPEPAPASLPAEPVEFPEPAEPTPMEMEVEGPPAKKRKTSNKARKTQTIAKIAAESSNLLSIIQEDLDKEKFDKSAERAARKYKKELAKIVKLVERVNTETKPAVRTGLSGFEKPCGITPELADFFGWDKAASMSRIDVNTALCKYIKEKDLQDPSNRRMIKPNPELKALLKREEDFNYAQMQGFISQLLVPLPPSAEQQQTA